MNKIGYCCICLNINENLRPKDKIKVNRGMRKQTFLEKGLSYTSELTIKNLKDTLKILKWNKKNRILSYRLSSDIFPWLTEYHIEDLPNFSLIKKLLQDIGNYVINNDMRIGFHPPHFCVLASQNPKVVKKSIHELNFTAKILDLMGLEKNPYWGINIHINTTQPSKEESAKRFCKNFKKLSNSAKRRLTIENDDKKSQFSVKNLYNLIHSKIDIPIVFDFHHFNYGPQDQELEEALKLAIMTWNDIKPLTHMSSSKTIEDPSSRETAHSDFIYSEIPFFNKYIFDCELEAKMKDKALLKYLNEYLK